MLRHRDDDEWLSIIDRTNTDKSGPELKMGMGMGCVLEISRK